MNTYLLPICSDVDNIIHKVVAKDFKAAEDKYIKILMDKYIDNEEIDPDNFSELKSILFETCDIVIGDIYSLDEFE
jgi:hypothetical protein